MTENKYEILYFPETGSTNFQASALLSERKEKRPFVIRAGFQERGRGRSGNVWVSEKNKNLLCSIALYPEKLDISNHFYLSKIAALSLRDILQEYVSAPIIKWPNDILVKERKIAGILIENVLQERSVNGSVIGIGLNVNQTSFPSFSPPATSIVNESGEPSSVDEILDRLLMQFDYWYDKVLDEDWQTIDSRYFDSLYRFNSLAGYSVRGEEIRARIAGVEPDGHLLLEKEDRKILRLSFGEVTFL